MQKELHDQPQPNYPSIGAACCYNENCKTWRCGV